MIYGTIASFPMILTIASFLTIVITINRYCKDQELSIWLSSGISAFDLLKQVAIFSLPLSLICAISSMYVTPWATSKSQEYANFLSKQQANMIISPGVFKEEADGKQVFYLDHYSTNPGLAKKIFIEYVDKDITYNITAEAGKIDNDNGIFGISLTNGNRYELGNGSSNSSILHFDEFKASVKQQYTPRDKDNIEVPTSSISQLVSSSTTQAKSELTWRISIAFMMFVMCVLAVPISIQTGRVQSNLVFIIPPIIYGVYENLILSLNGYVNDGKLSMIFIFLIHFLILLLGIFLTYLKTFPKGYFLSKNNLQIYY